MMTKPGITELDKFVDSRYTLVSMVAKRARMIGTQRRLDEVMNNATSNAKQEKPVTQAVNEITEGVVGYIRSEAVEKAREYEQERMDAISHLENDTVEVAEELAENTEETVEEETAAEENVSEEPTAE